MHYWSQDCVLLLTSDLWVALRSPFKTETFYLKRSQRKSDQLRETDGGFLCKSYKNLTVP